MPEPAAAYSLGHFIGMGRRSLGSRILIRCSRHEVVLALVPAGCHHGILGVFWTVVEQDRIGTFL